MLKLNSKYEQISNEDIVDLYVETILEGEYPHQVPDTFELTMEILNRDIDVATLTRAIFDFLEINEVG